MILISALKDLYVALPNSSITEPVHHNSETGNDEPDMVSWILDTQKNRVGSINWQSGTITIFDEYEYSDEVIQSLGEEKFNRNVSHFDAETDMPDSPAVTFENDEPSLTEQGKMLYGKPTGISEELIDGIIDKQ